MGVNAALLAFNRGIISRLGLARVDVKRVATLSAETMVNFIPRVLGSMSIRPGWKYLGSVNDNGVSKLIPFVFSVDDTALIEISEATMRVWRNDALITRVTVGTGVVNGTFATDLSDWTDSDEAGATSSWLTGSYMQLLGDGTNAAIRDQAVTVSGGDAGDQHALRIVVTKGPVYLRVGSAIGTDNYINETALGTGTHSLTFTPSGSFWIRLFSRLSRAVLVSQVAIEAAGVMEVTAPWSTTDLPYLRWDQSGDIVFVACQDQQQYTIERRSTTSWSVVKYEPIDGPFRVENVSTITLTPSAITGSITLTASKSIFRTTHVGALFSLTSEGQTVTASISAEDTFTDAIRITGVDSSRVFTILLEGTWAGFVFLQRSLDSEDGPWEDVTTVNWTANTTETFDDGLDNQIVWYRIGIKTGGYTSDTLVATLTYALGSITGVVRVTAYTDAVTVSADVLRDLGGTAATDVWAEGAWSDFRGWPTAVALHEFRLWWGGKARVWGSVSDAYASFDPDTEGDSGPISRSLNVGPADRINWMFSSNRLLMGGDLNEYAARSSSLDEPLTPTNFNVKATSGQGSASTSPARIDSKVVFANRTGMKVFENGQQTGAEYALGDLCKLVPDIGDPGIERVVVQRQPDTRIHAIRSDGTVALAVVDETEDVLGWCEIETDGEVEDAAVLPAQSGTTDDYVYYIVKRTINGSTVRYLEKWSQAREGLGGVGEDGTGSPFEAFSLAEAVLSDQVSQFQIMYSSATGKIYVPGPASDVIWVYDPANFTTYTQLTTGGYEVDTQGNSGCMSQNGQYIFLSGTLTAPVRAVNLSTGTVTELGAAGIRLVQGATTTHIMVYETIGGGAKSYTYDLGTGLLTLVAAYAVGTNSSIRNTGIWANDGAFWIFGDTALVRINPAAAGYTQFLRPVPTATPEAQVAYDSTRNRIMVSFNDGTILAMTDWTVGIDDSGTWVTLLSSQRAAALAYDAETDSLLVEDYFTSQHVYRYYMPTLKRIDSVYLEADPTSGADIFYDLQAAREIVYVNGAAYVQGNSSPGGVYYVIKIQYAGASILYDSDGNSLQPGGSADRINALGDSFIEYTGPTVTVVTGLSHLEGESVVVWANGIDLGTDDDYEQTFEVTGGQITLPDPTSNIMVGLPYSATFKSMKLGLQVQNEILFGKDKRITEVALVLANTHHKGVRFGPDFDTLDDRSQRDEWADVAEDNIDTDYDKEPMAFPGGWNVDARICLKAQAPRPCTVLAVNLVLEV